MYQRIIVPVHTCYMLGRAGFPRSNPHFLDVGGSHEAFHIVSLQKHPAVILPVTSMCAYIMQNMNPKRYIIRALKQGISFVQRFCLRGVSREYGHMLY